MEKLILIALLTTLNLFAGGGTLFIHNHSSKPVIVECSIISITGKALTAHAKVPRHHQEPLYWPSIQDLFPRETLRGIVFHIHTELYDEAHHLLNRSQMTHIFHRNPNNYQPQEVHADLSITIEDDHRICTHVGKTR